MNAIKRFIGKVKNLFSKQTKEVLVAEQEIETQHKAHAKKDTGWQRGQRELDRCKMKKKHRNRTRNKQARISRRINRAA